MLNKKKAKQLVWLLQAYINNTPLEHERIPNEWEPAKYFGFYLQAILLGAKVKLRIKQ